MQVVVDNTLVDYLDEGKGDVLLLVHGWRDRKETFDNLTAELAKKYRVIRLDLPNFGKSEYSDRYSSTEAYAEFVKLFLQKLEVTDYSLLGHSMGGQISTLGVGVGVLTPKHLIIVAGAGIRNQKFGKKRLFGLISKPAKYVVPAKLKDKFYKRIDSDYSPDLAPIYKKIINSALSRDIQAEASQIKLPTLLIYGEKDVHTPPDYGRRLHELIEGSTIEIIAGENHWLHQSASQPIAKIIQGYIR